MLRGPVSERAYRQARAQLLGSYCSEAIDCRYWDEGAGAWLAVPTVDAADERSVRCESDHLTDFIVVSAPSSWDEFVESALAGFTP
jgi:hypothetical protein